MVKKGLLFVSYYFPPSKSIAAVRNFNLCFEFLKEWKVFVLTTANQKHFTKDSFPSLNVSLIKYLFTFDIRTLISKKPLKSGINESQTISFFHKMLRSFPFNIIFGIGGFIYIIHGFWVGHKYIRKYNIKALYSSYFPYSDHLICYLLKQLHGDIKWVADFRDLQYYPGNEEILFPKIQRFFNRKILKHATLITTVSEGLKRHLLPYNRNVKVVRNSIGQMSNASPKPIAIEADEKLLIAYTGNIIPGRSSAKSIFEVLSVLSKTKPNFNTGIEFQYVGAYHQYFKELSIKYEVEEICLISKPVPISDAIKIQQKADVNILLSFNSPSLKGILTGKFYEYLGAQKPILLIINGSQDLEFQQIFDELNCGIILYTADPKMLQKAIDFILFVVRNKTSSELLYNIEKLVEYTSEFQATKILSHLKNFK